MFAILSEIMNNLFDLPILGSSRGVGPGVADADCFRRIEYSWQYLIEMASATGP